MPAATGSVFRKVRRQCTRQSNVEQAPSKLATNQTPRINPRDRKPGERRPLGGRPTVLDLVGARHPAVARCRAGVVPRACRAVDPVQRVQGAHARRPGRGSDGRRHDHQRPAQAGARRRAQREHAVHIHPHRGPEARGGARGAPGEVYGRGREPLAAGDPRLGHPARAARCGLELLLPPDERRRRRRHVVRAEQGEDLRRRRCEGELLRTWRAWTRPRRS